MNIRLHLFFALSLVASTMLAPCVAMALDPSKVVLLAAKGNSKSEAIAKYYAQKRAIPESNILYIESTSEDELERKQWNQTVKPLIKNWLNEESRKGKVDCVVVFRGISLNIVGQDDPQLIGMLQDFIQSEEQQLHERIIKSEQRLKEIAGDTSPQLSLDALKDMPIADLGKRFNSTMEAANAKIAGLNPTSPQVQSFAPILLELGGIDLMGTILQNTFKQTEGAKAQQAQLNIASLMGNSESLVYMINATARAVPTPDIIQLRAVAAERKNGILGALEFYRKQKAEMLAERTTSFDSELATVLWPDTPQFQTAAPNFRAPFGGRVSSLQSVYSTLMVGRVDGPTWPICKRLIDDALASEGQVNEAAKFYFDQRGLDPKSAPPAEQILEQSLMLVSHAYEKSFPNRATINNDLGLFEPDSCPDVFVYCGWLEPGKYSKIGNWLPGSIGYHISPISASELHAPESEAWCNRMLSDGACVVFGATDLLPYEYLLSPSVFAPESMDGTKSIVEIYFQNMAFLRTTNVLLGDPLYRPKLK